MSWTADDKYILLAIMFALIGLFGWIWQSARAEADASFGDAGDSGSDRGGGGDGGGGD